MSLRLLVVAHAASLHSEVLATDPTGVLIMMMPRSFSAMWRLSLLGSLLPLLTIALNTMLMPHFAMTSGIRVDPVTRRLIEVPADADGNAGRAGRAADLDDLDETETAGLLHRSSISGDQAADKIGPVR
eukprot:SAG25_NODE_3789_length_971_cov_1.457569_1_plen_129_part_00